MTTVAQKWPARWQRGVYVRLSVCVCVSACVCRYICVCRLDATGNWTSIRHRFIQACATARRPHDAQYTHIFYATSSRRSLLLLASRPLHVNTTLISSFSISSFIALRPTQLTEVLSTLAFISPPESGRPLWRHDKYGEGKGHSVHEELF